jgi:hypothetical protein
LLKPPPAWTNRFPDRTRTAKFGTMTTESRNKEAAHA